MAKEKPAKPAKSRSSGSALKGAAGNGAATTTAKRPATAAATSFSGITIGHAAGKVWGLLSKEGGLSVAAIKKGVNAPPDVVIAAIGWLAREDKLAFEVSGKTVKISLR